ncbi:hypothetical protein BV133_1132 [Blastochloris viridis]|uniref:Uncharacterized protein n=1 Tax=Blastochloris viridis TaxID=1079 RepID=A0A182CZT1_BLAVI|nr:hypothetical protein BV133_1132 [Blastochloris viridis]
MLCRGRQTRALRPGRPAITQNAPEGASRCRVLTSGLRTHAGRGCRWPGRRLFTNAGWKDRLAKRSGGRSQGWSG